ncbi:hypothetical protein FRC16_005345 [Serendipita sp. 398]|nr:hypothetical protein FRC16_005345 [Serendipita sp. 398]
MAMKVVQYLKDWNPHTLKHRTFILTTLKGGFLYSYRGLQNLTKGPLADNIGAQCTVRKEVFLWFGYQALRHVLLKKRAHWREFYTEIEAELKKPRYRSFAHQPKFVRVLRVGEQQLKGIVF